MQGKADRTIVYTPNHHTRGSESPLGGGNSRPSIVSRSESDPSAPMTSRPATNQKIVKPHGY